MKFETEIRRGRLLRRYKRFLADVELSDGRVVTAHCANPGSMLGLCEEGSEVWLLANSNPKAKLDWRLEVIVVNGVAVGVNTGRANGLVAEALSGGVISELSHYKDEDVRREVVFGAGVRLDFLLGGKCFVEVKSVTLSRRRGLAEFPDARTERGCKHLRSLAEAVRQGYRGVLLYVVQRGDCDVVSIADDIDGRYYDLLGEVMGCGVEVLAYGCEISEEGIFISAVPVVEYAEAL